MVPRLHADPLVDALALPLPAGGVPLRTWSTVNGDRTRIEPEYELIDTGVFDDDRYWQITVDYAKADTRRRLHPAARPATPAPTRPPLHVLPTSGSATRGRGARTTASAPSRRGARLVATPRLGRYVLVADGEPELVFCDNETNAERLFGAAQSPRRTRRTPSATTSCTVSARPPRSARARRRRCATG